MSLIRILSIDGGGVKGIIPTEVLKTFEHILQEVSGRRDARIADYFDIVAGTSVGGILTAMYLCPDNNNRPKFSADKICCILKDSCGAVFKKSLLQDIKTGFGFLGPKYPPKNMEKIFNEYFSDLKLSKLMKPCLITAYDIDKNSAVFFNKISALKSKDKDFFVRDVVKATASVPVYFEVAKFKSMMDKEFAMIDGGVIANNPTLCAYIESSKLKGHHLPKDVAILSIGTGINEPLYSCSKLRNCGLIQWAIPLVKIIMNGPTETVDYQLRVMFDSANQSNNYLRIQKKLDRLILLNDCSEKNINRLSNIGKELSQKYYEDLYNFAERLVNK